MRVMLSGRPVELNDDDLVGQGGEARVFRHGDLAVKVFYDDDAAVVRAKGAKLAALGARWPRMVVAPTELVTNARGATIGYAMPLVPDAMAIARLGDRKVRAATDVAGVCGVLARLTEAVHAVHAVGAAIGDLNDGNALVRLLPVPACFLIDVDSFDVPGHPCTVAHERFLDPRLFGRDLAAGGCFDPTTDAFALRAIVFQSLTCVHPFGGTHPAFKTGMRRMEARYSVLRGDVKLPRAALPYDALPDDLLHDLARCFHDDERMPFDLTLLDAPWTRCGCGLEHARARCPACAVVVPVRAPARAAFGAGGARTLFAAPARGTILAAAWDAGLQVLIDDGASVVREDGAVVVAGPDRAQASYVLDGPRTWVGMGDVLLALQDGAVVHRLASSAWNGAPAFAHGALGRFVTDGGRLKETTRDARLGTVMPRATWIACGARFGLGLWRAGRLAFPFVFGRDGALRDVVLPLPTGHIVELAAFFDDPGADDGDISTGRSTALLCVTAARDGRDTTTWIVVDANGQLVAVRHDAPARRALLTGGVVLAATGDGLCEHAIDAARGKILDGIVVHGSSTWVDESTTLVRGAAGMVLAVSTHEVTELRRIA